MPIRLPQKTVSKGSQIYNSHAESRLARAKDMGFRTNMPVYHGSGEDFSSFQAVPTSQKGLQSPGVSVALDPEVANEFALSRGNEKASPQVYPLVHRADRPTSLTLDGTESHAEVVGALRDAFESGHDALMLRNYTTPGGKTGKNIIIVRDANRLRSPNAKFDPAKRNSADLLASVGRLPRAGGGGGTKYALWYAPPYARARARWHDKKAFSIRRRHVTRATLERK